jgi:hypothetical protein
MLHELVEAMLLMMINMQNYWRNCRATAKQIKAHPPPATAVIDENDSPGDQDKKARRHEEMLAHNEEALSLAESHPVDYSPRELVVAVWDSILLPRMNEAPNALHCANNYRKSRLYKRRVDNMLHVHLPMLKVRLLCSYCARTVLVLCSYCARTVLVLCSYCARTVLVLYSYYTCRCSYCTCRCSYCTRRCSRRSSLAIPPAMPLRGSPPVEGSGCRSTNGRCS